MRYFTTIIFLIASVASAAPSSEVSTLAIGKANEYTEADCKDKNGGNKASFPHKPACGCVKMDETTYSVYIATSPGQKVYAYSNGACNPHADMSGYLGQLGGECQNLPSEFPSGGAIQSVQFYTPVVCNILDMFQDLPENIVEAGKVILGLI